MNRKENITLKGVNLVSWEMTKGQWASISNMLRELSDEEFEKIPTISSQEQKNIAELYGICDMIPRGDKYTYVYCLSSYIFRGETMLYKDLK
jgi:hypothetical protein